MMDICLCTHNPRPHVLRLVLRSVAQQNADRDSIALLLVDNASSPPLTGELLQPLRNGGIACRLVCEPQLGIFHARNRAMRETGRQLVLWLDDDTELPLDYVTRCLSIAEREARIGCFGGRLLAGPNCIYPAWCVPFLPYLAIIDRGPEVIRGSADHWGPWEPPTAGAVVRRTVIDQYLRLVHTLPPSATLGQVGTGRLLRGEDSLLMRTAARVGLECSYQPELYLWHHIDNRRFSLRYLARLFYGYGRSCVMLERILGQGFPKMSLLEALNYFCHTSKKKYCDNWQLYLARKIWNVGFLRERGVRLKFK